MSSKCALCADGIKHELRCVDEVGGSMLGEKGWGGMELTEKRLEALKELEAIQSSNGNYDPYMMGMANGLILAVHIMSGAEGDPQYKSTPDKWLKYVRELPKLGNAQSAGSTGGTP